VSLALRSFFPFPVLAPTQVSVQRGDFWESPTLLGDGVYDLIHIDVANTGEVNACWGLRGRSDLLHLESHSRTRPYSMPLIAQLKVFRFAVEKLLPKLTPGGLLLLEGGSSARDQVMSLAASWRHCE
jgi:hypothetical protein